MHMHTTAVGAALMTCCSLVLFVIITAAATRCMLFCLSLPTIHCHPLSGRRKAELLGALPSSKNTNSSALLKLRQKPHADHTALKAGRAALFYWYIQHTFGRHAGIDCIRSKLQEWQSACSPDPPVLNLGAAACLDICK